MPVIHKTWKVKIVTEAMNLAGKLQWDKRQIPSIGGLVGEGSRPVVLRLRSAGWFQPQTLNSSNEIKLHQDVNQIYY